MIDSPSAGPRPPGIAPYRSIGLMLWRSVRVVLAWLGVVIGGLTLFLALAPLFGYLPYSDRPGPGWYGRFPAVGWAEFWLHAWEMAGAGAFFAILFILPATLLVLAVRACETMGMRAGVVRVVAALLSALVSGYWAMAAAWYIAGAPVLGLLAIALGAVAGACVLPADAPKARVKRFAWVPVALFATVPVMVLWEMGPEHSVSVRFHPGASHEQVERAWRVARAEPRFRSGGVSGEADGGQVLVFTLHPRASGDEQAAFRRRLARTPGVASVRVLPPER